MLCNKHTPAHPRLHGFRHQAPASGSQVCGVSVLGRVCLGSSRLGSRSGPRVPRSRAAARGTFSPGPWQVPRRPNQTVQTLPKPLLTSCPLTFHWPMQPSVAVVGMYTPSLRTRHHKAMRQGVRADTGDSVPSTTLPCPAWTTASLRRVSLFLGRQVLLPGSLGRPCFPALSFYFFANNSPQCVTVYFWVTFWRDAA